jgi:hypothetical protein
MKIYEHSSRAVIKFLKATRKGGDESESKVQEDTGQLNRRSQSFYVRLRLFISSLRTRKVKMPSIRFTKEDLLARKQLTAGWRLLTVQSLEEEAGKTDPTSINFVVTVKVTGGADDGVTIKNWFSEKRRDLLSKFVECFAKDRTLDLTKDYELGEIVGRTVEGYCQYDVQRNWNSVLDWRPAQKASGK